MFLRPFQIFTAVYCTVLKGKQNKMRLRGGCCHHMGHGWDCHRELLLGIIEVRHPWGWDHASQWHLFQPKKAGHINVRCSCHCKGWGQNGAVGYDYICCWGWGLLWLHGTELNQRTRPWGSIPTVVAGVFWKPDLLKYFWASGKAWNLHLFQLTSRKGIWTQVSQAPSDVLNQSSSQLPVCSFSWN